MAKKIKATLFISEDKREKIRRSGLSMEEYFNRLYEMHERLNMDRWVNGCFWIKYLRVCFLRAETLNLILDHLDDETLLKIGREAGKNHQNSLKYGIDPLDDESPERMLEHLSAASGWGDFILDNGAIIILTPVFTKPFFLRGYLEGALNLKLTLIESHPDRMIFDTLERSK